MLQLGLLHGAALCASMTGLVFASLRHDPMIWVKSGPKDLQAFLGPQSAETKRRMKAWRLVMLIILVSIFGHLSSQLGPGTPLFVASLIAFQLFNLYDALVLDVALVVFKPRWAFVRGSESLPGLHDVRWHALNYARGFVGGFVFAGVVTGLSFVWSVF